MGMVNEGDMRAVQRYPLSAQVADIIRDQILTGQLEAGERLVQADWAQRLGVSRMPVRDAINQLAAEGIVHQTGTGQAVVLSVDAEDIRDGYQLHTLLSSFAARRAAQRRTDDEVETLESIQEQIEAAVEAGHRDQASRLNWQFHSVINEAARSSRLSALLAVLAPSFPHATFEVINDWPQRARGHHRAIIDAIRDGDGDAAASLIDEHFAAASEAMLDKVTPRLQARASVD